FFCFLAFSERGKNMMFGGRILKTWDGVSGKRKIVTTRVKVHAVEAAPTLRFVGLELSMSSFGGYQMVPITLPLAEARSLRGCCQKPRPILLRPWKPNIAFKPKLHRYAVNMAERACHVANSALQFGLT